LSSSTLPISVKGKPDDLKTAMNKPVEIESGRTASFDFFKDGNRLSGNTPDRSLSMAATGPST